jgi:hypothetical protein
MNPEFKQVAEPIDHARRRRAVVDAVRRLLAETK